MFLNIYEILIGIARGQFPIHNIVDPTGVRRGRESQGCRAWRLIVSEMVIVIPRIHRPRQPQMPVIIHAHDRLAAGLGTSQRWKQQTGEDGDDANDHGQLNQ